MRMRLSIFPVFLCILVNANPIVPKLDVWLASEKLAVTIPTSNANVIRSFSFEWVASERYPVAPTMNQDSALQWIMFSPRLLRAGVPITPWAKYPRPLAQTNDEGRFLYVPFFLSRPTNAPTTDKVVERCGCLWRCENVDESLPECAVGDSSALALLLTVTLAQAQIYAMTDGGSRARVSPNTQAGMFNWSVQNDNQLAQQWFWYAGGSSEPASINTISLAAATQAEANNLTAGYAGTSFNLSVGYTITGGDPFQEGNAVAGMGESIRINNTPATALSLPFYEDSAFRPGRAPGPDTITLSTNPRGGFNDAYQAPGFAVMTETVTTPPANHAEAVNDCATVARLNDGVLPVTHDGVPTASSDVAWAFEWDLPINPDASALVNKDYFDSPEPSSLALVSLGLAALAYQKQRRKACRS